MAGDASDAIRVAGMAIRFLVEGEQSDGSVAIFEFEVPVGTRVAAAHSHDGFEETIYGVDGVLTWTVDGAETEVGPGEVLLLPRGVVHQFENRGDTSAKSLAIVTPGLLGPDYFREAAEVLDAAAGGPPDLAAIAAIMRRHGLTPVVGNPVR
jgi:quercetin dioxygenase-like cupin family protein